MSDDQLALRLESLKRAQCLAGVRCVFARRFAAISSTFRRLPAPLLPSIFCVMASWLVTMNALRCVGVILTLLSHRAMRGDKWLPTTVAAQIRIEVLALLLRSRPLASACSVSVIVLPRVWLPGGTYAAVLARLLGADCITMPLVHHWSGLCPDGSQMWLPLPMANDCWRCRWGRTGAPCG